MAEQDIAFMHGFDSEMPEIQAGIRTYIMDGDGSGVSVPLMGLEVFGVIAALREGDEEFHGDGSILTEDQRTRVQEVEALVDEAVETQEQYFPFGQNRAKYTLAQGDRKQMHGDSSWGVGASKSGQKAGHGGEIVAGRFQKKISDLERPGDISQGKVVN